MKWHNDSMAYKKTTQFYVVKLLRAFGGCLGINRRRRTRIPAISLGELENSFDPWISEWGNPVALNRHYSQLNT